MSLTTAGVWAANVWAPTVWVQDVWYEPNASGGTPTTAASGHIGRRPRVTYLEQEDEDAKMLRMTPAVKGMIEKLKRGLL